MYRNDDLVELKCNTRYTFSFIISMNVYRAISVSWF